MSDPEPGWYDDPGGAPGTYRWWDGAVWTRWLTGDRSAPAPAARPAPVAVEEPAADVSGPVGPVLSTEPLVRLPLAVAVVTGALLVAVVAVGAVVAASAQGLPSGPALDPPSPSAVRAVGYDPGTRVASVGPLRVTLAGPPYVCGQSPQSALPTFETAVSCNAPVHENYDGTSDWAASTGVGVVPAGLVTAGDLEATGRRVLASARAQFFRNDRTTLAKLAAQPTDLGPGAQAEVVSAEVHYRVPHVASRYDRLLVVVVALPDGTHAAVVSSRPDDSGTKVQQALQASLDSVAVG